MNKKSILKVIFISLLMVFFGNACVDKKAQKKQVAVPGVLVQKVVYKQIKDQVVFVGRTVAINDVSLQTQVRGYLLEVLFKEGTNVKKGEELFVIDSAIYQANVAAAEGNVAKAKADQTRAEKDLARYNELLKTKNISQQQVDVTASDVLQTKAQVKYANAELQKAQLDLSYTRIKSPINGRIGQALISVGNIVEPQTKSLARVVELAPIYVHFNVSERDIIEFKRRQNKKNNSAEIHSVEDLKLEVALTLPDGSLYKHTGYIDFVDNAVEASTGSILIRAKFDNPDYLLVPGMYVRTTISRIKKSPRLLIHASAIQEDQAGKFVMLVNADNKIERRTITTGKQFAGDVVILSGLQPDEKVLVEGIQKVRPGMLVKPKLAILPGDENTSDKSSAVKETATKNSDNKSKES
ncbi:MAG: efflux RND transporter periplasmic adaptor subunit [Pseudomonadota bacterium]